MFLSFSRPNHAESSRNLIKKSGLNPKCVKFEQKSEHGGKAFGKTHLFLMHFYENYIFWDLCIWHPRWQIGSGRVRPSVRIRPNPPVRLNSAELRLGTAVRIWPNSDWGRPPESCRKAHKTWPKSEFWSIFACFGFKICFSEEISRSFRIIFGLETHEHIKTMKKRCLEANFFFVKMH